MVKPAINAPMYKIVTRFLNLNFTESSSDGEEGQGQWEAEAVSRKGSKGRSNCEG